MALICEPGLLTRLLPPPARAARITVVKQPIPEISEFLAFIRQHSEDREDRAVPLYPLRVRFA